MKGFEDGRDGEPASKAELVDQLTTGPEVVIVLRAAVDKRGKILVRWDISKDADREVVDLAAIEFAGSRSLGVENALKVFRTMYQARAAGLGPRKAEAARIRAIHEQARLNRRDYEDFVF